MPPKKKTGFDVFFKEHRNNQPFSDHELLRAREKWKGLSPREKERYDLEAKNAGSSCAESSRYNTIGESYEVSACRMEHRSEWRKKIASILSELGFKAFKDKSCLKQLCKQPFIVAYAPGSNVERSAARQHHYLVSELSLIKFSIELGIFGTFNEFPKADLILPSNEVVIERDAMYSHLIIEESMLPLEDNGYRLLSKLKEFCTHNGSLLPIFTYTDHMEQLCIFIYDLLANFGHGLNIPPPWRVVKTPSLFNIYQKSAPNAKEEDVRILDDMEHLPHMKGNCGFQIWPVELFHALFYLIDNTIPESEEQLMTSVFQNANSFYHLLARKLGLSCPGPGACEQHLSRDCIVSCALKKIHVDFYNFILLLAGNTETKYVSINQVIPIGLRDYIEEHIYVEKEEDVDNELVAQFSSIELQNNLRENFNGDEENIDYFASVSKDNKIHIPSFFDDF